MSELKYKCILFDLDGTVLDTVEDCKTAINLAMKKYGFPEHTSDEVRSYLNNGARMLIIRALPEEIRRLEKTDAEKFNETVENAKNYYIDCYLRECMKKTTVYPGITELLIKLKELGAVCGIVTNKPDVQTKKMIPHYFGTLFKYYEGNSDALPTKPDKKRVGHALSSLGFPKEKALFVGDSYVDVLTAHNGGIPCCGVSWGFSGEKSFSEHPECPPDYYVCDADSILDIVRGITE